MRTSGSKALDLNNKGNACIRAEKYKEALRFYEYALEGIEKDENMEIDKVVLKSKIFSNMALAHLKLQEYDMAIDSASKSIEIDMTNAKAYYRRGTAKLKTKQNESAEKDFRKANSITPGDAAIMHQLKLVEGESIQEISKTKKNKESDMPIELDEYMEYLRPESVIHVKFSGSKHTPALHHPAIQYFLESKNSGQSIEYQRERKEKSGSRNAPSIHKQRDIISQLMKQFHEQKLSSGYPYYFITKDWWETWCNYVDLDNGSKEHEARQPESIDNLKLLDDNSQLMEGLMEDKDIKVISGEVWKAFLNWYGGGPAISRSVEYVDGEYRIEFHPKYTDTSLSYSRIKQQTHNHNKFPKYTCSACGIQAFLKCSQCYTASYCCLSCQMSHWKYHRRVCKELKNKDKASLVSRNGKVGLSNLGNTCFMNAAIQCLSHTWILNLHFLNNKYQEDLNESNPLGTGGKLASIYACLMKELWFGYSSSVSPTELKRAISRFAPQFSGFQQHDSQELLAFLLDGLHEDLNRVHDKPYVEIKEADGRDDAVVARESWEGHLRRNQSVFVENMQGQFKSTVVCPECRKVSITFDPFNCVQLELPVQDTRVIVVKVSKSISSNDDPLESRPIRYAIHVPKKGSCKDLKIAACSMASIPLEKTMLCDIYESQIFGFFPDSKRISKIREDDTLTLYSPLDFSETSIIAFVLHRRKTNSKECFQKIGDPLSMSFSCNATCMSVLEVLALQIRRYVNTDGEDVVPVPMVLNLLTGNVYITNQNGQRIQTQDNGYLQVENSSMPISKLLNEKERYFFLSIYWKDDLLDYLNEIEFFECEEDESMEEIDTMSRGEVIHLNDCFKKFTSPELLDEENLWYCASCKEHRRALKTMGIWRLPRILIVSLKRFEYRSSLFRDKLDHFVDFPLESLDMSRFCIQEPYSGAMYDLFAVTNHYGRMGFGHYTSFARNLHHTEDKEWYYFDDSSVTRSSSNQVKTKAAYILFYERRETKFNN